MEDELIPSVLACDVGNSTIHLAHIQGDQVAPMVTLRVDEPASLGPKVAELWSAIPKPRKIVAASVNAPALHVLEAALEAVQEKVLVIGRDLPLPIETDLPHPKGIGVDRLCAAVAAFDRLGVACVIGDFGTAITIDCVNDNGVFLGGAILPGLRMGAEGLSSGTAALPRVELEQPDWVYGKDTRQAIVGGLVYGARGALRELVEDYATDLGHWPVVIITGGDAPLICPRPEESDLVQAIVPDLVLRGVAAAYYRTLLK